MDEYRSKDWKQFRDEVIRLDGGACSRCGRTTADGVVLQVHHSRYVSGHKPWEYPYEACYTLCGGCHAAEHGIVPPKFGWEFVGWEDLGGLVGQCDCCQTAIRYSFIVSHERWHAMEVGEICCDNLTSSQVASGFMESKRRYASRLKRFVSSSRWGCYSNGCHHIIQKGLIVRVLSTPEGFRTWVNGIAGRTLHADLLSAKISIFEAIETGAVHSYLAKHRLSGRRHG